jgi:release factor glutamine methyltransferase
LKPLWTIKSTLEWTQGHLGVKGEENPRLAAQWLLCAATGLSRIELYTNYDLPLSEAQLAVLREGIKRRLAGEPLQYILGKAPFRRLELVVRAGVLIPRPETEVLVEVVLAELGELAELSELGELGGGGIVEPLRVLDLCTGSGCIALSLLQECAEVSLVATDNDPQAFAVAQENAELLGYAASDRLLVIEDDLASSLVALPEMQGSFDVVVSNPPYVPTSVLLNLPNEIAKYEPSQALDGGEDGLAVFRRIVEQAILLLKPGGLLACELFETCLDAAQGYCESRGFVEVKAHCDLTGCPRIITAHNAQRDGI